MNTFRMILTRTGQPIATQAIIATTFRQRLQGFLGRDRVAVGEAMIFPGCRSIHTVGMRCAIDAVFVDRSWRVVALRPHLVPGRVVPPVRGAWGTIEMASGTIERVKLQCSDQLTLES